MNWKNNFDGMSVGAIIAVIILALALAFGVLCFNAWILMLLWNAVVPVLWTGAPHLSFWLAMGLILICNILFKSVGHSSGSKS